MATISVDDLLCKPFNLRSPEEKKTIVVRGRPKPSLPNFQVSNTVKSLTYLRPFLSSKYEQFTWLTASEKRSSLYCWPCLLFGRANKTDPTWSKHGFRDLNQLTLAATNHDNNNKEHNDALVLIELFKSRFISCKQNSGLSKSELQTHNGKVEMYKDFLQKCITFLGFQALQQKPLFEKVSQLDFDKGKVIFRNSQLVPDLEIYLKTLPRKKFEFLKNKNNPFGDVVALQNDLSKGMSLLLRAEMDRQINLAYNVSIIFDLIYDTNFVITHLATYIRYCLFGSVYERFIGFEKLDTMTDCILFEHLQSVVLKYKLQEKLVAISFDSLGLPFAVAGQFMKKMSEAYPKVFATDFNGYTMKQVVMQTFCLKFSNSSNKLKEFYKLCSFNMTSIRLADDEVQKLSMIKQKRFIKYESNIDMYALSVNLPVTLEYINMSNIQALNGDLASFNAISTQIRFLTRFDTVLLIGLYSKWGAKIAQLDKNIDIHLNNVAKCHQTVKEFIDSVRNDDVVSSYEAIWNSAKVLYFQLTDKYYHNQKSAHEECFNKFNTAEQKQQYLDIYRESVDIILTQASLRFPSLSKITFVNLVEKNQTTESIVDSLQKLSLDFNYDRLKDQLKLFSDQSYFKQSTINELYTFLNDNDLDAKFDELFKLVQMIMSLPSRFVKVKELITSLDYAQKLFARYDTQERTSDYSFVAMQPELMSVVRPGTDKAINESLYAMLAQFRNIDILTYKM